MNFSAMSFGSLSGPAIEALNRGAALAGCTQNTGEGGLSPHHRHGGELVLQIGTAYFGCRDEQRPLRPRPGSRTWWRRRRCGRSRSSCPRAPSPASAACCRRPRCRPRSPPPAGIPMGKDCVSPSRHAEFSDTDSLLDWVELLAAETGLPVGIKSAVGDMQFWCELADLMVDGERGVDFVTIDGGEGGTGAAPLDLHRHRSPCRSAIGFARVYGTFAERGAARTGRVHRRRQARPARQRRRRLRARRRHGERRAGGDAGPRLHPGPEVPHRPLPDRRGHAERVADPRARPDA